MQRRTWSGAAIGSLFLVVFGLMQAKAESVLVELDIFSGRPNPTWMLRPEQTAELENRLSILGPARSSAPRMPGLGYRGLIVSGLPLPGQTRVGAEIVESGPRLLADPGRMLERWLLETGRGHVSADLLVEAEQ